jgi:hypothetical protein
MPSALERHLNGGQRGHVSGRAVGILERIDGRIADDCSTRKLMPCPTEQTSGGSDLCP